MTNPPKRARRATSALVSAALLSGMLALPAARAATTVPGPVQVWKKTLPKAVLESSPVLADLDGDGKLDVVVGSQDGKVWAVRGSNGTDLPGWPQATTDSVSSSAAVADTDGDGRPEIFIGSGDGASAGGAIYSFRTDGGLRFRFQGSDPARGSLPFHATPALGDVNGDGAVDVTAGALGLTAWSLSQNGAVNGGWPYYADDTIFSSAALVDVNGDGQTDVVMGGDSSPGGPIDLRGGLVRALTGSGKVLWEFRINEIVRSSPSVGDIDGDGKPEIVFGAGEYWATHGGASDATKVFALDLSGRLKPGWPKATDGYTLGSPALADLDGDGRLDVAMGTWGPNGGSVYAWSGNGSQIWARPSGGGVVIGSLSTADLNGDGAQDVLVPGGGVWAYDGRTGNQLFALTLGENAAFQNAAAMGDVDGNGRLDIVIAGQNTTSGAGVVYRFELPSVTGNVGNLAWPMFRKDARRTGSWVGTPLAQNFCTGTPGGYWLTASDGGVFAFCDAPYYGSTGNIRLAQPITGMTPTPAGGGYWMVARDGGIFAFGDAGFFGSTGNIALAQPIVGMATTPGGNGYWLVARDGGIFAFGDGRFFGSTGDIRLNQPIVAMAPAPSGKGYWMVASDGGVFNFGDAGFLGSTGNIRLTQPIVAMAATPSGNGYWMVASDGGIFAFGDARFLGSTGSIKLSQPIVSMAATPSGNGYWLVASDGGIFAFGDATFKGSTGGMKLAMPIVGMARPSR